MELHYIGAKWCKACIVVKPKVKELSEQSKLPLLEHDYDALTEKEQATIEKLPTIRILENGVILAEFMTSTASDSLKLYLQSKKLLPEEEF